MLVKTHVKSVAGREKIIKAEGGLKQVLTSEIMYEGFNVY